MTKVTGEPPPNCHLRHFRDMRTAEPAAALGIGTMSKSRIEARKTYPTFQAHHFGSLAPGKEKKVGVHAATDIQALLGKEWDLWDGMAHALLVR